MTSSFADYRPETLEVEVGVGPDGKPRILKMDAPDMCDIADVERIYSKEKYGDGHAPIPYDEWWSIKTVTDFAKYEEGDQIPEGKSVGDLFLDASGEPKVVQKTRRMPAMSVVPMMAYVMARKQGLTLQQIENEEWHWKTYRAFLRLCPAKYFLQRSGDIMLFFCAAADVIDLSEPDTSSPESPNPGN